MSSRIFISNIPKHITEDKLKKHFSTKGEVTDCKILKRNGVSRQIGFIGYRNAADAEAAVKFFNGSFLTTAKINVELADAKGESTKRPWSRHSKGSSAYERIHGKETPKEKEIDTKEEASEEKTEEQQKNEAKSKQLEEFLNILKSRNTRKMWKNEEGEMKEEDVSLLPKDSSAVYNSDDDSDSDSDSDSDEYQDIEEIQKKKEEEKDKEGNSNSDSDIGSEEEEEGEEEEDNSDNDSKEKKENKKNNIEEEEDVENLIEEGRLFIQNLPYTCTEDELRTFMETFGPIADVLIPLDKNRKSKGFGYVTFMIPEQAIQAIPKIDNKPFEGRNLKVKIAKQKKEVIIKRPSAHTYKGEKYMSKVKEEEEGEDKGWNSLYLNKDSVMQVISGKLGVENRDILNVEEGNMAVKLALAETELLEEVKEFYKHNNVDLDVLEKASHGEKVYRSNKVILVKNLPYPSEEKELYNMFSPYGEVQKVAMPESKTVALVYFTVPSEAKKAFIGLAYRKYKHIPLYLEWLPIPNEDQSISVDLNEAEKKEETVKKEEKEEKKVEYKSKKEVIQDIYKDKEEENNNNLEDITKSTTLYIKNLNFDTQEEKLKQVFGQVDGLISVTIARRPNPAGGTLSMGFGFVTYNTRDQALKALNKFAHISVDGHELSLKFSAHKETNVGTKRRITAGNDDEKNKTKLMIRNIAFETNRNELRELFGSFGQLKSLRLPRKFDGTSRGFAFVEYLSADEAKAAYKALGNTHLLGRKLVVEWANEDDTIEDKRKKIRKQLNDE
ncbi:hypothetical protein WA158_000295 [Blastocystis sp. Blastoise]